MERMLAFRWDETRAEDRVAYVVYPAGRSPTENKSVVTIAGCILGHVESLGQAEIDELVVRETNHLRGNRVGGEGKESLLSNRVAAL
jgi:hypothetical protein